MTRKWTPEDLTAFETRVADVFNGARIRAPVHLSDGSEEDLIRIFGGVRPQDYVFCSWRSHYQCLLKGVPPEEVFQAILDGRSISLCFPEYRVFSSAMVAGNLPIAVGAALGIKRAGGSEQVWCFIGDMTAETGMAQTCFRYSQNHSLPVNFVVEDNGVSVCTDTREVWGDGPRPWEAMGLTNVQSYRYKSRYPHAGAGTRVQF